MQVATIAGLMAVGLLAGCGGVEVENEAQETAGQSQPLSPICPPGYYVSGQEWQCVIFTFPEYPCFYVGQANQQHYYCSNGTDTYDAGPYGDIVCGECY